MGIPKRFFECQVSLALLVGALFPLPLQPGQTHRANTVWLVKYVSGSEPIILTPKRKHFIRRLRRGDKIKLQVSNSEIDVRRGKKLLLSIPDPEVTEIIYGQKSHRLSKKVVEGIDAAGGPPTDCGLGCPLVAMVYVGTILATLPFKYKDYVAQIRWQENQTMHAIKVRLSKRNYPGFLDVLQKATNKPPKPWPKKPGHSKHK